VLPFYLSKATRPSPALHRDAPSVIRARIRAVTSACVISSLIAIYIIVQRGNASALEALHLLGWWPIPLLDVLKTLLLCMILFVGPLFEAGIAEGQLWSWIKGEHIRETLGSWIGWRNLVAGPVTEELMFRSVIIPLHLLANMDRTRIIFITPLYFGIAHVHHFYEFVLTHPEAPIAAALLRSLVQFAYTSLFGFFAAFVFLRTGSLYAAIIAHSFCNWAGLPRFWGRLKVEASEPIAAPPAKKDAGEQAEAAPRRKPRKQNLSIGWTVVYYALLFMGAGGFYYGLFPLTESWNALVDFGRASKSK